MTSKFKYKILSLVHIGILFCMCYSVEIYDYFYPRTYEDWVVYQVEDDGWVLLNKDNRYLPLYAGSHIDEFPVGKTVSIGRHK